MAEKRKQWDLTSVHALEGAAEWIRKRGDAIVVMIVRSPQRRGPVAGDPDEHGQDYAYAVDERCAPADAAELIRELLPQMVEETNKRRAEKRDAQVRKRAAAIAGHAEI